MAMAILALIGFFLAFYLFAHNVGWVGPIPCGSGDCGVVQSSSYAWVGPVPVSGIGLAGYLALFALAMAGIAPRAPKGPALPLLLFCGALAGFAFSAYLTYIEARVLEAWCRYCVISQILIGLLLLFALPELKRLRANPGG